jgi:isopentenyl-diphosphate delta-isomerase
MEEQFVILVDNNDNQTGSMSKLEAHEKGLLHRAISVFIINSQGEWILQRRAFDKYHSNGLWTNTCCTHPKPGESNIDSAKRRLSEEMGINCDLIELFSFTYKEKLDNGYTENEFDHVFFGISDNEPIINTSEVEDWVAVLFSELHEMVQSNPNEFTFWFKEIYKKVNHHINMYPK